MIVVTREPKDRQQQPGGGEARRRWGGQWRRAPIWRFCPTLFLKGGGHIYQPLGRRNPWWSGRQKEPAMAELFAKVRVAHLPSTISLQFTNSVRRGQRGFKSTITIFIHNSLSFLIYKLVKLILSFLQYLGPSELKYIWQSLSFPLIISDLFPTLCY